MTLVAAADGSALGNPGAAGWAWYIDDGRWRTGGWKHATNNQAELMAVLSLLQETAHSLEPLHILCDSQYVINSLTKWLPGWKRRGWRKSDGKAVLNRELLEQLDAALQGRSVTFEWVKGHAGHPLNERVDLLARETATAFQAHSPHNAGPGFGNQRLTSYTDVELPSQTYDSPSLFDAFDELDNELASPQSTLTEWALSCERILKGVPREGDSALAGAFSAHPESCEVLSDGTLVDSPRADPSRDTTSAAGNGSSVDLVRAVALTDSLILVVFTYRNHMCSSIWEQQENRLLRRFHQSTPRS